MFTTITAEIAEGAEEIPRFRTCVLNELCVDGHCALSTVRRAAIAEPMFTTITAGIAEGAEDNPAIPVSSVQFGLS
jgi:hypothetical protein